MSYDINSQQIDIENLFKQNVNDLSSIKELYRKLKDLEEKITQIKYIDSKLADKLKKDYESLKRIILDENIQAKLTNDINEISSQLDTKVNLSDLSEGNRKIKILTGILRNDDSGWSFIEDDIHSKLNSATVTQTSTGVELNYGFTAKKILSFVACTDETLAKDGYFIGSSVGTNKSIIELSRQYDNVFGVIKNNGNYYIDSSSNRGLTSVTWDNNSKTLTINHNNVAGFGGNVESRYNNVDVKVKSMGNNNLTLQFFKKAMACGYIYYDVSTSKFITHDTGKVGITSVEWDNTFNALKITHSLINAFSGVCTTKSSPLNSKIESMAINSTYITFYDQSGNKITSPSSDMKVFFQRSEDETSPYTPQSYEVDLMVSRTGWIKKQINPSDVQYAYGNIWCMGVFEV